jgi:hypothetical protein
LRFAGFGCSVAEDEMIQIAIQTQGLGHRDRLTDAPLESWQRYFEDLALCNSMFDKEDTLFRKMIDLRCMQVDFVFGQHYNSIVAQKN